ncbi:Metallo-hydrolase/oxidoreductase [Dothidotthia symphoricarpi CBS 119687]|uniref:Metallo-hydrolase/oxidoreductase n=1 Tax=Dothidotthia symphoricarpi CBS 119687 TaxID=1392245 RepID=A0A6A6AS30_9PLEO|nr:Metallo-hydrolase/oxidoreductase [Dothidotthia symphoricarpi CBS 119687]KAF2133657.1 Metallo-hydrolase/oxidoreductase [Dothidotthia symphoricarpi CBS 119687]
MAVQPPSPEKHRGGYRQINKALNICAFQDYLDTQLSRLPEIADVEVLSPRVIRVLGQNAGKFTLQGTNCYIIGTGSQRMLIDTAQGLPEWADLISSTLADANMTLSHVFLTHWHGDHTGGVPDLLRMYPTLKGSIYKHMPNKSQQPITDSSVYSVEGATLRAVHAPGHAQDHTCFVLEEEMAMFTGDNVLGHGTAAVEQLSVWVDSLRVMQSHNCQIGYPAHGTVIKNLPRKIELELRTKERRETQVLRALSQVRTPGGKSSVTVKQLVTVMHGNELDLQVRQMAIEPLMDEVLKKLAEDGKVAFEIRRKEKKWFAIM